MVKLKDSIITYCIHKSHMVKLTDTRFTYCTKTSHMVKLTDTIETYRIQTSRLGEKKDLNRDADLLDKVKVAIPLR